METSTHNVSCLKPIMLFYFLPFTLLMILAIPLCNGEQIINTIMKDSVVRIM